MDPSTTEPSGTKASSRLFVVGAVILFALNILVGALGASTARGMAYLIGFLFGGAFILVAVGLVVYGIARALGKARTGAAKAKIAFWTMAVLLLLNFLNLVGEGRSAMQAPSTAVTNAERAGLQIDADSIRHAELEFVLPHPGSGFSASPELQRQLDESMSQQPDMVVWAFRDTVQRQALVIQVTKVARADEKSLREFASGIRTGLAKAKVLEDTLTSQNEAGDYRLTVLHPTGLYIAMRCLPRVRPAGSFIVCVQTTTGEQNALESSRAGLRFIE
jgi:hypothetical protein